MLICESHKAALPSALWRLEWLRVLSHLRMTASIRLPWRAPTSLGPNILVAEGKAPSLAARLCATACHEARAVARNRSGQI